MNRWRIVRSLCLARTREGGEFAVCLSAGLQTATAVVSVCWSRASVTLDDVFDPAVTVERCTDDSAREWLAAHEHEYAIAERLGGRAA